MASAHPEEPHGEGVSGRGLLFPYVAETGLQELAKGLPAPLWRNDTKRATCCCTFPSPQCHFTHLQPSLCGVTLSPFQQHHSLLKRPSFSSPLSIILHPGHSPTYCSSTFALLSPCSLLIFLNSCPHYPLMPQSQRCSVSSYWVGRKKPLSTLSLSSFP